MIELFTNLTESEKEITKLAVNRAFNFHDVPKTIKFIEEYRANCTPAVQEFIDFYVQLKLEEMKNEENNSNQR